MAVGEVVVQEPGQLGELLREVVGALVQPVGAAQGGGGRAVRAGRAAEAKVDAARSHGLQGAELFGDDERGVVGQHHPAGAEPEPLGVGGEMGEDHGRGRRGDAGHGVVFGDPEAVEAAAFGELRDVHAGAERLGRGAALAHAHQVEHRERHGGRPLGPAANVVASVVVHVKASPVMR